MTALPTFCGKDCGGNACPLLAHVEDGRVVTVTDNPAAGPYLKGCRRGFDLPREASAPQRITRPLVRDGERGSGRFREAGWDEALRLVADGLADVRARFGARAVLNLSSAGSTSALHATGGLLERFLALCGGSTNLTGSYSCGAADFVLPFVLGGDYRRSGFDPATMQHSEMIILWGANVLEARLGTEIDQRLLEAGRRGTRIVVIDPRRSATARRTDAWWIPVRPGTDAALMLAVLHVLVSEGLVDRRFVDSHSIGFDALERYVLGEDGGTPCTPAWAQAICGTPADEILRFARALRRGEAGDAPAGVLGPAGACRRGAVPPRGGAPACHRELRCARGLDRLAERQAALPARGEAARPHPGGTALGPRGSMARRRARGDGRRKPIGHPRHLQRGRQPPQPGRRHPQERRGVQEGGFRGLSRTVPDPDRAVL